VIAVHRPVLLIGRHAECDVRIESSKVSRRHCCIAMAYDRILIRDLGSRNGVRVNGRVVDEDRIEAGDELAIGPILFRLEREDEEEPRGRAVAMPVPVSPKAAVEAKPVVAVGSNPPTPKPLGAVSDLTLGDGEDSEVDLVPLED
jgi:pSer/pThr/pTyr-binding forkhead associated (FHA) protein